MTLTFRTASSETEIRKAQQLAIAAFPAPGSSQTYKQTLWESDPSFRSDNIFIATDGAEICAVIRAVERVFRLDNQGRHIDLSAACLSSVCVDPKSQGQGISRKLNEYVISELEKREIHFSYLIARRAVDHYYTRFGFAGISSYEHIQLNAPSKTLENVDTKNLTCRKFGPSISETDFAAVASMYDFAYRPTWGRCCRSLEIWKSLLSRIDQLKDTEIFLIENGMRTVGYFIRSGANIEEIGIADLSSARDVVAKVHEHTGIGRFQIPHQHRAVEALANDDILYSRRSCVYGGHMVRVINRDLGTTLRDQLSLEALSTAEQSQLSNADQICYSLGIRPPWPCRYESHSSFNLSFPEVL